MIDRAHLQELERERQAVIERVHHLQRRLTELKRLIGEARAELRQEAPARV